MAFKLVVADPKTGKSYKLETEEKSLLGLKIGEKFQGDSIGLAGYELELTGGSDKTGTPMRKDVKGSTARRILLTKGVGFHAKKPGERRKKRVFGYKIGADIVQVNFKVTKPGAQPLDKLIAPAKTEEAPKEGDAPTEAPKEEAPTEEKPTEAAPKEEAPAEAPKEEKPAEAPKEEVKEEVKPEPPAEEPPAEPEQSSTPAPEPNEPSKEEKQEGITS